MYVLWEMELVIVVTGCKCDVVLCDGGCHGARYGMQVQRSYAAMGDVKDTTR